mmetsp:Transcript_13593/g.24986  ORF Transcript_13593/g.24986 Transcript_13593/m.24986 type:complete len:107 (-) Transcript_13593:14-334(-)
MLPRHHLCNSQTQTTWEEELSPKMHDVIDSLLAVARCLLISPLECHCFCPADAYCETRAASLLYLNVATMPSNWTPPALRCKDASGLVTEQTARSPLPVLEIHEPT